MRGIADLVESAMEDSTTNFIDENSILSSASDVSAAASAAQPQPAQAKRGKKRHRVTMPTKTRSKVQKVAPAPTTAATKRTTATKRKAQALEEHIEETETAADGNGNEDHDVEVTQEVIVPKRKKVARAKEPRANATKKSVEPTEDGMEVEASPVVVNNVRSNHATNTNNRNNNATKDAAPKIAKRSSKATTTSRKAASAQQQQQLKATAEPEEVQSDAVEETEEEEEEEDVPQPAIVTAAAAKPIPRQKPATATTRDTSRARQEPTTTGYAAQRRAGSASDTDNRGDPNLRRKLGDITRKFENVDLKYRNLKEVGIHEASTNMERLRKQCDAAMAASNDLIASLKKELAAQAPLAQEARKLKKQMQTQEQEMGTMRKALGDLESSLNAAQNENKALQAKLAAARAPSVDNNGRPAGAKTPGSAIKAVVAQRQGNMTGSAEAAQIAQMKEDLYSDLTGLIIRSVKRTDEGDTYDCIQTGRNGTLHFKLYVDQEDARTASFEETEFLYTPLLDANRDRDMIELMPTYLTEDITFARQNAAKFYGRVVDTLTKRRAEE